MPARPIITVTLHPTIDRVIGPGLPSDGRRFAAGKGVNVSRALARLGSASTSIALCPNEDRAFFDADLVALGPGKVEFVPVPVAGRVRWRRTVAMSGEMSESLHVQEEGSPGIAPTDGDLDRVQSALLERVTRGTVVAFCGSVPPGVSVGRFSALVEAAIEAGAQVLVDTSGQALVAAAGLGVWAVKSNGAEAEAIFEAGVYCKGLYAVTSGDAGLVVMVPKSMPLEAAVSLPENAVALDTVGCGDACTAGMLRSWSMNPGNIAQMAKWGVAAGTASVASIGPGEIDPVLFKKLAARAIASTARARASMRKMARELDREGEAEGLA
jgi:fructose-1-phosphate kinase PfkB-like protein